MTDDERIARLDRELAGSDAQVNDAFAILFGHSTRTLPTPTYRKSQVGQTSNS
jgi:hypothetical protein